MVNALDTVADGAAPSKRTRTMACIGQGVAMDVDDTVTVRVSATLPTDAMIEALPAERATTTPLPLTVATPTLVERYAGACAIEAPEALKIWALRRRESPTARALPVAESTTRPTASTGDFPGGVSVVGPVASEQAVTASNAATDVASAVRRGKEERRIKRRFRERGWVINSGSLVITSRWQWKFGPGCAPRRG